MPHNPKWEDYQRSYIAYVRALRKGGLGMLPRPFPALDDNFRKTRDKLPQTDRERAFHLVADAAELIDLKLPIATEDTGEKIIAEGHRLLNEALRIDEHCYDAIRMSSFAEFTIYDDTLNFLAEFEDEVKAYCERERDRALKEVDPNLMPLVIEVEMGPYLRWLTAQSTISLVCGRNRQAIAYANKAFEADSTDVSDARFTAALAYAKLEDDEGLRALAAKQRLSPITRAPDDPWMTISKMCIAYKRHDIQTARVILNQLIARYSNSIEILYRQAEFPDGVFARLHVAPYTPDELALAVSEATVLFQECTSYNEVGAISGWIRGEIAQKVSTRELERLNMMIYADFYDNGEFDEYGSNGGVR